MKPGHGFDQRLHRIPPKILKLLTKIDECKGGWQAGAKLNPQILGRLKQFVLVTSTGASTRIEGARLSDPDVKKLMQGIRMQKFSDRDKQEVRGYFELLKNIFEVWKSIRFSENTIKHFHKELLKFVSKDELHRGEYKKKENKVMMVDTQGRALGILFDTTPAYLTPKEMQELTEWTQDAFTKEAYHPLLIVGNFVVEFLKIHPFEDGNGRLSRILTNLLLMQCGYVYVPYVSHEKLIEDKKTNYYAAFRKSQKTFRTKQENLVPWLEFFLEIVLEQSEQAMALLSKERVEELLSEKQLAVLHYLRQAGEASPRMIESHTKIVRPTINQILNRLLELKQVERIGLGRSTRYQCKKGTA